MKKLSIILALFVGFSVTTLAQEKVTTNTKTEEYEMANEKMPMKDHVCTKDCKDGKHLYKHGEKGHKCSEACMKMHAKDMHEGHTHDMDMKHECSKACKDGKHMYKHGEKGHKCDTNCKKMK